MSPQTPSSIVAVDRYLNSVFGGVERLAGVIRGIPVVTFRRTATEQEYILGGAEIAVNRDPIQIAKAIRDHWEA